MDKVKKNKIGKKIYTNGNSFLSIFYFITKKYFTSWNTIYIYLIALLPLISWGLIVPIVFTTNLFYSVGIVVSSFFTYGIYFFIFQKSTLYDNFSNTKKDLFNIYFSIFLLVLISNILVSIYIFSISTTFYHFGISRDFYAPPLGDPKFSGKLYLDIYFDVWNVKYLIFLYYILISTIMYFMMSFFIQNISNSVKSYMIISISYLILMIIFGSSLGTQYYPSLLGTLDGDTFTPVYENVIKIDSTKEIIYLYPSGYSSEKIGDTITWTTNNEFKFSNFIWWCQQLTPTHFVNSMLYSSFMTVGIKEDFISSTAPELASFHFEYRYFLTNNSMWVYILVMPYVWIFIYATLGGVISDIKRKRK